MSDRLAGTDYYAEIIKHCVREDTKYFTSSWFYTQFPETDNNMLKNLCSENLLKTESPHSRTYYVTQYYSNLRYIGLCCAAYMCNNQRSIKSEIAECARQTYLCPDLIEFLNLTYDLTTVKKAGMLEMTVKEVTLLEDYYYLRLASNIIKNELVLPVGSVDLTGNSFEDT